MAVTATMLSEYETGDAYKANQEDISDVAIKRKRKFGNAVCVLIALLLLIILSLSVALTVSKIANSWKRDICLTPSCVENAGIVLTAMNSSEAPCNDFYEYACGSWVESTFIPPDKTQYNSFSMVARNNQARLKKILEVEGSKDLGPPSKAVELAKVYYQACMNLSAADELGLEPLYKTVSDLGSWPVKTTDEAGVFDASSWDFSKVISRIQLDYFSEPLFQFQISADDMHSDQNIIFFTQGGLTFGSRDFYIDYNPELYEKVFKMLFLGSVQLMGGSSDDASHWAQDLWDFEVEIAKLHTPKEERVDMRKIYKRMTWKTFKQLFVSKKFHISKYLHHYIKQTLPDDVDIVTYDEKYFSKLGALIDRTPNNTLAAYTIWQEISSSSNYLNNDFRKLNLEKWRLLYGQNELPARWETCIQRVDSAMPYVTGALFVSRFFSEDESRQAETMVKNVIEAFREQLSHVSWMDEKTKAGAFRKLDALQIKIGYPKNQSIPSNLDDRYGTLSMDATRQYENKVQITRHLIKRMVKRLGKPVDKDRWFMSAFATNAYYSPSKNEMVFPAGIFQPPFYSNQFSMAQKYSGIGAILGHELSHGFDNRGRTYNKDGNLENWWSEKSSEQFDEKAQCIIDQYQSYRVGDKTLNGVMTQGENIADNGGLRTAYKAYKNWLKKNNGYEHEALLPGLNMTEEQVFFLNYGQIWCHYSTLKEELSKLVTDPHSNKKYRVVGPLSNNKEFSEAFQCKEGSPMNPTKKCIVW